SSRRRHTRSKRDWSSDVCSSDLFFSRHHHRTRFGSYRLRNFHSSIKYFVIFDESGNKTGTLGLLAVNHAPGKDQIHSLGLTNRARQSLRTPHAWDDSQIDLGLTKLRLRPGNDHVCHHCYLTPTTE